MSDELCFLSAVEQRQRYRSGDLSPVEVTAAVLARSERLQPQLNAFVTLTAETALGHARAAERAYRNGTAGPLAGVAVSFKDLTPTKGVRTTMGSLLFEHWTPDFDAPVVERLLAAGAVLIGKTNTPEFGWKGETTNRVAGTTCNPWQLDRTPGGSSGGAAAAVAAGLGALAQGSDGAGSVRIPAAFSGIFGLKPSFGLVPQYPPSAVELLSHMGPMTRTVRDAALMLSVMAGADPRDPYTWSVPGTDYLAAIDSEAAAGSAEAAGGDEPRVAGLRVAYAANLGNAYVDPEVAQVAAAAALRFAELGCEVDEIAPDVEDPFAIISTIWTSSMAAVLSRQPREARDRIDPGLRDTVTEGERVTGPELAAAIQGRHDYLQRMRTFMETYDLLLTPTMPLTAFAAGLDRPEASGDRPLREGLSWTPFTYPFNITGQPAATVPCGIANGGLPVGLQIVGRWREDATVLRAAAAYEALSPWAHHTPPLS